MLGPEIDSHDMVVRMNGAPTHGFEANVGNKTTFGFINHAHFKRLASMEPPKAQRAADGKGRLVLFESNNYQAYFRLYSSLAERFPPDELRMVILSPDFTSASYELWQRLTEEVTKKDNSFYRHKKPTTGWFAAAFAAEICDQVDLYGFEAYKRRPMQRVKYHYFDKVQGFTNVHSFELTVKVFQHLGSVGFPIRIVAPGNASSP
uniref:N-acetylgalactosaminide alpha-2,6-sialyltransferase (Sialyltransferase 7E) n=1 Tax=Tetraselmis sp. GSL018 TaxID=582737 RepID=A0A061S222_9CHLO